MLADISAHYIQDIRCRLFEKNKHQLWYAFAVVHWCKRKDVAKANKHKNLQSPKMAIKTLHLERTQQPFMMWTKMFCIKQNTNANATLQVKIQTWTDVISLLVLENSIQYNSIYI